MTDQAMIAGLEDIATRNVHPTLTINNAAADTNPAANTTTPTNSTGVSIAGINPAVNTTTSLQDITMIIAFL